MTTTETDRFSNPPILSRFNAAGLAVWDMVEASLRVRYMLPRHDPSQPVMSLPFKIGVRRELLNEILASVESAGRPSFQKIDIEKRMDLDKGEFDFFTDWPLARLANFVDCVDVALRAQNWIQLDTALAIMSGTFGLNGASMNIRPTSGSAMSPALIEVLTKELREKRGIIGPWGVGMEPPNREDGTKVLSLNMRGFSDGCSSIYTVDTCWISELETWILQSELQSFCSDAADRYDARVRVIVGEANHKADPLRQKIARLRARLKRNA